MCELVTQAEPKCIKININVYPSLSVNKHIACFILGVESVSNLITLSVYLLVDARATSAATAKHSQALVKLSPAFDDYLLNGNCNNSP